MNKGLDDLDSCADPGCTCNFEAEWASESAAANGGRSFPQPLLQQFPTPNLIDPFLQRSDADSNFALIVSELQGDGRPADPVNHPVNVAFMGERPPFSESGSITQNCSGSIFCDAYYEREWLSGYISTEINCD